MRKVTIYLVHPSGHRSRGQSKASACIRVAALTFQSAEEMLRQATRIQRFAAKHGAYNVRVFGSFARGEAGPQSDLDLLISVGPKNTPWFPGGGLGATAGPPRRCRHRSSAESTHSRPRAQQSRLTVKDDRAVTEPRPKEAVALRTNSPQTWPFAHPARQPHTGLPPTHSPVPRTTECSHAAPSVCDRVRSALAGLGIGSRRI